VETVETHISIVHLVGKRAFKLKKALRFPYLDFSTLEKRRAACEAEVRLNRRTAPEIYCGVVAVTRGADGALTLRGEGEAVEWLVEMARFDQDTILDRVAARDGLSRPLLERLAEEIADFHAGAEVRRDHGGAAGLGGIIESNAKCYADWGEGIFDFAEVDRLNEKSRAALAACAVLLDERREDGRVRRCHGDLHLRNICLFDGRPTLFDCIEFNDTIACIDTLYDLAFLLMDLDERGMTREASIVFNRYMDVTGDSGGLAALPLMLSVRAGVRAHVGAAAAQQFEGAKAEEQVRECRQYLAAALRYLSPPRPRLIAVGGLSGSGKSRLARALSPHIGAPPGALVARSDTIRKRLAGAAPLERLPESAYSHEMTERVYAAVYEECRAAVAAGHAAIADAVFARPEQRAAIAEIASDLGVPFTGLWVEAPPEVMEARIRGRRGNASDATVAVLHKQMGYETGPIDWRRVDSGGSKRQTLRKALALLGLDGGDGGATRAD
jgi:aminoglycoside phosphotransferase family enzyme/predicted kinase